MPGSSLPPPRTISATAIAPWPWPTDACRQTDYKQDYILSTLAAAYAETGDFESARKWAAQAVEAKPSEHAEASRKDELKKELESYQANKPWREALPHPEEKKATKKADEKKARPRKEEDRRKRKQAREKKKKPARCRKTRDGTGIAGKPAYERGVHDRRQARTAGCTTRRRSGQRGQLAGKAVQAGLAASRGSSGYWAAMLRMGGRFWKKMASRAGSKSLPSP